MMMRKRAAFSLAGVVLFCLGIPAYLFYFSPNKGYYRTKCGLKPGEPLKLYGKVIDQYGESVPGYRLEITPSFESSNTAFLHSPIKPYYIKTDAKGEYTFDSSPVRLRLCFYGSAESWGPEIIGSSYYHTSFNTDAKAEKMGDVIFLDGKRWMRDARKFSPIPVPLELPLIYLVGKSGRPQRMLEFYHRVICPASNESWISINILDGTVQEGRVKDADFLIHGMDLDYSFDGRNEGKPFHIEILSKDGSGVQFASDPFLCEAPPDGYKKSIEVKLLKENGEWHREGAPYEKTNARWPIYFISHGSQVYGVMLVHLGCVRDQVQWVVDCRANPRGSRNLNKTEAAKTADQRKEMPPIKPPITLPFAEPPRDGKPSQP